MFGKNLLWLGVKRRGDAWASEFPQRKENRAVSQWATGTAMLQGMLNWLILLRESHHPERLVGHC